MTMAEMRLGSGSLRWQREPMVIERIEQMAEGVVSLTLVPRSGDAVPTWAAGAHIDVELPTGVIRQYSLCGNITDRRTIRISVLREAAGRGGSAYIHDQLKESQEIVITGPRNNFVLEPARRYLFIAGGIGITPLLSMITQADASGIDWELHYGGRSSETMAFREELVEKYGERVHTHPADLAGRMDLASIVDGVASDTAAYACGPAGLLDALRDMRTLSGRLHIERFVPEVLTEESSLGFEVVLERSGLTLDVPPTKSVLEVVEEAGIYIESQCRVGTCGTCETTVCAGRVLHRDVLLSEEEKQSNESMMVCVSRSLDSTLRLDL